MAMYPYYAYENHTGFVPSPITTIVGPESVWLSFLCIVILLNREAHKRTNEREFALEILQFTL